MSRTDRAVRHAARLLDGDEALIASTVGIEADGRRRQVVLLTDRRLLIVPLRALPPTDIALDGCAAAYERSGGLLTVDHGGGQHSLRRVEEGAGHRIVALLAGRRPTSADNGDHTWGDITWGHVRIMDAGAVRTRKPS